MDIDSMTPDFLRFEEMLRGTRSIRRFKQCVKIDRATLRRLVGLTRYTPSGRNLQPLKYRIVVDPRECERLFPHLRWAGYLTDWNGPEEGERPAAYLLQCLDRNLSPSLLCDDGIELETIALGAHALGLGSCIIKSFDAAAVSEILGLTEHLLPVYLLALGVPAEIAATENAPADGNIRYWRDEEGMMHVPKRSLDERLL